MDEVASFAQKAIAIFQMQNDPNSVVELCRARSYLGLVCESEEKTDEAIGHFLYVIEAHKKVLVANADFGPSQFYLRSTLSHVLAQLRGLKRYSHSFEIVLQLLDWGVTNECDENVFRLIDILNGHGLASFGKANHGELSEYFARIAELYLRQYQASEFPMHFAAYLETRTRVIEIGARASEKSAIEEQVKQLASDFEKLNGVPDSVASKLRANFIETKSNAFNRVAWQIVESADRSNSGRAVNLSAASCELTDWKDPAFLDTLAAAHALDGSFGKAVEFGTRAYELAPESMKSELESHLELYGKKQILELEE